MRVALRTTAAACCLVLTAAGPALAERKVVHDASHDVMRIGKQTDPRNRDLDITRFVANYTGTSLTMTFRTRSKPRKFYAAMKIHRPHKAELVALLDLYHDPNHDGIYQYPLSLTNLNTEADVDCFPGLRYSTHANVIRVVIPDSCLDSPSVRIAAEMDNYRLEDEAGRAVLGPVVTRG